jgi:RNA polymerase sigma-70 factor (ECF subfamily)
MPDDAETAGLLALMLIHDARREARVAGDGRYVALPDQDRGRWDAGALAEGRAQLDRALRLRRTGPYQLQAAIASLHCEPEVDWPQIAALYRLLACMAPSPVIDVNRAVALGMAGSPDAGLALLERVELDRYQPFHVARAELLRRSGDDEAADGAYARALELSANAVERAELERRRAALSAG